MNRDLELYRFIAEHLEQDQRVVILVVAESSGSSPGRQGFKMAVADDALYGSIGGGVMEVALVERAKIESKKENTEEETQIIEQVHRENSPNTSGMICSGEQTVISFRLDSVHLETVSKIILAIENEKPSKLRITNDKLSIENGESMIPSSRYETSGTTEFLFEETLGFKNRLYIVGGGHCALALSEIMSKMDFHISLFDDRPDLNTLDKNEFVHEKIIIDQYEDIGTYISSGQNKYVVVMTLGYKFDEIVIRKLAEKEFKYFGVLGSKAKMTVLLRELENEGIERGKLAGIHTPIGLGINSRTPEEIAVSIAAEIIAVKNAKG